MAAIGLYMVNYEVWPLYSLHKSIAILLFALILLRVIWRAMQGLPPAAAPLTSVQHLAVKLMHVLATQRPHVGADVMHGRA